MASHRRWMPSSRAVGRIAEISWETGERDPRAHGRPAAVHGCQSRIAYRALTGGSGLPSVCRYTSIEPRKDPPEGPTGRGTVLGCREPPPLIGPCVSRARTLCLQLTWPGLKTTPRTSKGLQIWVLWHLPEIFHPLCLPRISHRLAATGRDRG